MDHTHTMLQLNQIAGLSSCQPCSGNSCPKIGCDKHYSTTTQCLYGERVGKVKDTSASKKKQYQCTMCSKSFAQSISLKRHIRTHTGEKPFQCKDCSRRFTNSSHLTTHMRTHTGERPFQCDMCGKKFSQHSGLHVHIRTHTGDKPYKCELCGKGFLDRSALKRHGSTHLHDRESKRKGAGGAARKMKQVVEVVVPEVSKAPSEVDDLAALLCVRTLQDYFTSIGVSHLQDDLLHTISQRSLLHTLANNLPNNLPLVKQEQVEPTFPSVTNFAPVSSQPRVTSQSPVSLQPHVTSSHRMTLSPAMTFAHVTPRSSPLPIGLPSPPSTPVPSFLVSSPDLPLIKSSPGSHDVTMTTPSRDVTMATPSRDVTMCTPSRSSALSPPFSITMSPENGLNYYNAGSPNMPFICAVSTVTSLPDKTELDLLVHSRPI